ncbi:MAG TPA: hypothetical protein VMO80_09295 [Terriglobales bacterium]|nr:hypothetical protein [Terriglobales bacterium]
MNKRFAVSVIAASLVLACASIAFAQETRYPDILDAKPMFKAGPNHMELAPSTSSTPATGLRQWNGSFKDLLGFTVKYTMVGTNPASTNVTSTIPVYIIPIKMVYGATNGNRTFNPSTHVLSNGKTVVNNIIASPIFNPGVNFTQGSTNLGTTQYIDAFQRGNFWKYVQTHTGYHVLLGKPTVLATQTITVPKSLGGVFSNPFGGSGIIGTYDFKAFDAKLQTYIKNLTQINPGVLPIFVTYDVFLTEFGCCIGGYHNANGAQPGGQTYAHATYVDSPGSFAADVSALSHEIGEWVDDPFVDNYINCNDNSILEVGDPLENNANYGNYPYTLGGFAYHLQSLTFIGYFGAPKTTSVHSWLAFQNDESHVCPGQ